MDAAFLIGQLFNGLSVASLYILVALGVMRVMFKPKPQSPSQLAPEIDPALIHEAAA